MKCRTTEKIQNERGGMVRESPEPGAEQHQNEQVWSKHVIKWAWLYRGQSGKKKTKNIYKKKKSYFPYGSHALDLFVCLFVFPPFVKILGSPSSLSALL